MNKATYLIATTLLAVQPLAVSADSLDGPVELDAHGLDAVTAGSGVSVPPSVSIQALSDAVGDFVFTNTRTTATVQGKKIPQQYGNLMDWLNITGGTSMATALGDGAGTSTAVLTTPEAALSEAINPFTNTISYTQKFLNSEITVFAQYSPNGPLLDYTLWRRDRMMNWGQLK